MTGGGISNRGSLQIDQSTISTNSSGSIEGVAPIVQGGGIYNSGTLTITNSTIANNRASYGAGPPDAYGAGIYNLGTLTLTNCTITGNSTFKGDGGGVYNKGGNVQITNCTIANNLGDSGHGGIVSLGTSPVIIKNNIVALNNPPGDIAGSFTSLGYNLIGDNFYATISAGPGDQIGTDAEPIDPMLGPLQNNGGATQTQALLPGSPAIDQGGSADGVTTDQRGRSRPVDSSAIPPPSGGNNSDIGAFEIQADPTLNISTRALVLTGENILDGGFIVTGTDDKEVLIRGLGPSLGDHGVTGFLIDPTVELHDLNGVLQSNDDWRDTQESEIEATGIPPTDDLESAIVVTLAPGEYTVILQGNDGPTGIGLVEIYDLNPAANSALSNLSSRSFVQTEDNVMIGGFILGAGEGVQATVLVRALGPSLAINGVMDPLPDPALELHDENGALIVSNENWKDTQEVEIEATGLAPANDKEAAILQVLASGPYTAIVRGADQTTGVGLVEIYNLH